MGLALLMWENTLLWYSCIIKWLHDLGGSNPLGSSLCVGKFELDLILNNLFAKKEKNATFLKGEIYKILKNFTVLVSHYISEIPSSCHLHKSVVNQFTSVL